MEVAHLVTLSGDDDVHVVFKWIDTLIRSPKKFTGGTYQVREVHKHLYLEEPV